MRQILIIFALVQSALCGIFDFTEFDDPFNNLFNRPTVVIRQHHGRCSSSQAGTDQEGVCLTRPECSLTGGQPLGRQSCLLGVCCIYSSGCNQISTRRVSYFEGTSRDDIDSCSFTVRAENNNICQMRLDFESLNLPPPTREQIVGPGNTFVESGPYLCRDAAFIVESPNNGRIPNLCGNNNGQHIYVPVNASKGERDLVIKIVNNLPNTNNNGNSLSWKIKVTQLECPSASKHQKPQRAWEDSHLIAPEGCLQYYINPSGTIRNLGFDTGRTLVNNHYEANFNYATCFKRSPDTCGVDFTVNQFSLSGIYDPTMNRFCTQTIDNVNRDTDFVFVPNGILTANIPNPNGGAGTVTVLNQDRYCGIIPPSSKIRSVTPGPLYILFRTDNQVLDLQNMPPQPGAPGQPSINPENGWEMMYTILRGSSCGLTG